MKRPTFKEFNDSDLGKAKVRLLRRRVLDRIGPLEIIGPRERTADVTTPRGSSVEWAEPDDPIYHGGWIVSPGELNKVSGRDSRPKKIR